MKYIILVLTALLVAGRLSAQTVTVIDQTTRQAIPGVLIYSLNPNVSVTTNARGQADISPLAGIDTIYFQHVSYKIKTYSFTQLEAVKFFPELTETTISLNEVVVSANRWEMEQIEIPYSVEVIKAGEVSFQNPQTSADLIGLSGYAYIQKSQLAGGSPSLRGFATNRVMLVVDGVRMNTAIFRTGNIQNVISIDASSLGSTEILFGPGAVMYGSDAIGGVMDFHTLKPTFSGSNGRFMVTGNAFGRFSSANNEKTGHFDLNAGFRKIAFVTSVTFSDYDDLRAGSRGNAWFLRPVYQKTINSVDSQIVNSDPQVQVSSGFSQVNLMQKIRFRPDNSWDIDYSFHYSATSDAPRYDRLCLDANDNGKLDYAEWYYGPQKWMMNRLGVLHSKPGKLYDQFRLVAALQNLEESRHDRKFGNPKLRNQTESVEAFSVNLDLDKKIGEKAGLFYGVEAVLNKVGSVANRVHTITGAEEPTNTRYPDGSTWQAYGLYTSLKYKLSPAWIVNTGLRYSIYRVEADFDTSMFPFPFTHAENNNGALNGSLGCVFSPGKTLQVYLNGSTGFRAPNIDDIGKVFESEPGSVVVPNADLAPEYAWNIETGMAKTFGNHLKIDFAAYYTLLDHALARRDFRYNGRDSIDYDGQLSRVQAIQNISQAWVYGIQAGIEINFGNGIGLSSTICYQKGEEESDDSKDYYPISHIAPTFGSTHLTYGRKKISLDLYAVYNSRMDYEELPLPERNDDAPYAKDSAGLPFVPGWYTLNLKAGFYISKNLSLTAGIENISDQLYRPFGSGISAPGKNYIVVLKFII